jgi:hypothetical protein
LEYANVKDAQRPDWSASILLALSAQRGQHQKH